MTYDPAWGDAIGSIESSNNYAAVGPKTKSGDQAYGRYQIMGANIPAWTKAATGEEYDPDEFLADKDAQDATFKHVFGGYADKYGNPQDAAHAWLTGGPRRTDNGAADVLGTTGAAYVDKFNKALAQGSPNKVADTPPALTQAVDPGVLTQAAAETPWYKSAGQTMMNMAPGLASISSPAQAQVLQAAATANNKPGSWSAGAVNKKTGMVLMTNTNGQTKFVKAAEPDDQVDWVHLGKDGNGIDRWGPRPTDAQYAAQKDAPAPSAFFGDDTKQDGPEFYKTIDPVHQKIIDGWHDGTGILPSPRDMNKPDMQKLIATATKAYPDTDFRNLPARQRLANTLTDANPGSNGGIIANSNTAIGILNDAADQHIALHNSGDLAGSSYLGNAANWAANKASNSKRADIINHLAANGDDASGEITKVLTGGPGGVEERKTRAKRIADPTYVPSEAAGALEGELNDLSSKHQQTVDKVRQQMGQSYLDRFPVVEKNFNAQEGLLRAKIEKLRGAHSSTSAPAAGTRPPLGDIFK